MSAPPDTSDVDLRATDRAEPVLIDGELYYQIGHAKLCLPDSLDEARDYSLEQLIALDALPLVGDDRMDFVAEAIAEHRAEAQQKADEEAEQARLAEDAKNFWKTELPKSLGATARSVAQRAGRGPSLAAKAIAVVLTFLMYAAPIALPLAAWAYVSIIHMQTIWPVLAGGAVISSVVVMFLYAFVWWFRGHNAALHERGQERRLPSFMEAVAMLTFRQRVGQSYYTLDHEPRVRPLAALGNVAVGTAMLTTPHLFAAAEAWGRTGPDGAAGFGFTIGGLAVIALSVGLASLFDVARKATSGTARSARRHY